MILDERSEFAGGLSAVAPVGITTMGDMIDRASGGIWPNITAVETGLPPLVAHVIQTFTSSGAATAQFRLVSSDTTAMGSPTLHFTSGTFSLAQLVEGKQLFAWQMTSFDFRRYLAVQMVVAGASITGGRISLFAPESLATLGRVYARAPQ